MGTYVSELLLFVGTLSLFSIFILMAIFWADLLKGVGSARRDYDNGEQTRDCTCVRHVYLCFIRVGGPECARITMAFIYFTSWLQMSPTLPRLRCRYADSIFYIVALIDVVKPFISPFVQKWCHERRDWSKKRIRARVCFCSFATDFQGRPSTISADDILLHRGSVLSGGGGYQFVPFLRSRVQQPGNDYV